MSDVERSVRTSGDEGLAAEVLEGRAPATTRMRVARALLAPVLALGAVGIHFQVNVPENQVVENNQDQGAKRRAKNRKALARRQTLPQRSAEQMEAAWQRWGPEPFEGEPIKGKWGRQQQSLVNKAVAVARKAAFTGAPEQPRIVISSVQCRTIRCRLILRSPFEHELTLISKTLEGMQAEGEPLWRAFEHRLVDPPTPQSPPDEQYLEVIVGIQSDGVEAGAIEAAVGGEKPAEGPTAGVDRSPPKADHGKQLPAG